MGNQIVDKQINIHIVPFVYGCSFEDAKELMNLKCQNQYWRKEDFKDLNLYQHIKNLIRSKNNTDSTIGKRYVMGTKGRSKLYDLPNNEKYKMDYTNKDGSRFKIVIKSVELFLFETQIGFITFDIRYENEFGNETDLDSIINNNYNISHLYLKNNKIEYQRNINKEESYNVEISLLDIIHKILSDFNIKTYFDNSRNLISPRRTLVYSHALMKEKMLDEEMGKKLFEMRRVFKKSYKPSNSQLTIQDNEEVIQLFENYYWGISQEGICSIAYYTEDNNTNIFFKDNYVSKVKNSYLYMYILILHIKYSLLYFSLLSSELPSTVKECSNLEKIEDSSKIRVSQLKEWIVFFRLRCIFRDVSNIKHQNVLYQNIWKVYNLESLLDELDSQIRALSLMTDIEMNNENYINKIKQQDIESKKEQYRMKLDKKNSDLVVFITVIFTTITTLGSIEDISKYIHKIVNKILKLLNKEVLTLNDTKYIELTLLILIVVLISKLLINNNKYWKKLKSLTETDNEVQ